MRRKLWRGFSVLGGAAVLLLAGGGVQARVVKIVVDAVVADDGAAGVKANSPYERLTGRAFGELDPTDRRNSIIQDIELAPRNDRGRVEYVSHFTLVRPRDRAQRSGVVFYDVNNRGNESTSFAVEGEPSDQFFLKRGAMVLRSGWQGDIPWNDKNSRGLAAYPIQVPVAKKPDGSAITGKVLLQITNPSGSTTQPLVYARRSPYAPASLDTKMAVLTKRGPEPLQGPAVVPTVVSGENWAWADCTKVPFPGVQDPTRICVREGFDPGALYELVYTAKDPLVLGIGFAATRDIVAFFRANARDDFDTPNPVAGQVRTVIAMGTSQTGQFVRTFINLGFNEDETGKRAWDGTIANIAGRQLGLNIRFSLPDGTATTNVPDGQGVLWWGDYEDKLRGHPRASLLDRCRATETCPKIFETFGSGELWVIRMSPGLVGTSAPVDVPLPADVRRYYSPSTKHGGGSGGFSAVAGSLPTSILAGPCLHADNPNTHANTLRALFVALDNWIERGVEPPASRFPRLSDNTLKRDTQAALNFPNIPGLGFHDAMGNPQFDYDFGPALRENDVSGVLEQLPPRIRQQLPVYVAAVDADGNELSGLPSVLLQAPLGTYTGWNIATRGVFAGQYCPFAGSFIPFKATEKERIAAGDPRSSLQARYRDHAGYVAAVRQAAARSVADQYLLREDADLLVRQAERSDVLK